MKQCLTLAFTLKIIIVHHSVFAFREVREMSEFAQNEMTVPSTPKYHKVASEVLHQYQEQVKNCDLVCTLNFDEKMKNFGKTHFE